MATEFAKYSNTLQHLNYRVGLLIDVYGLKHRCKKRFLMLFYFGHVFNVFLIFQTFFILKNVGKLQSGKQINKKHFQNNSNEIDL